MSDRRSTKAAIGAKAIFVLVPAGGIAAAHRWFAAHIALALALTVVYEAALAVVMSANRIGALIAKRWELRVAERLDAWMVRTFTRQRARYCAYVGRTVENVRTVGVPTRGTYALELQRVFVDLGLVSMPIHDAEGSVLSQSPDIPNSGARGNVWQYINRKDGRSENRLAILGGPGSGKTTLVEHCAKVLSGSRRDRKILGAPRKIPAVLTLRKVQSFMDAHPTATLAEVIRFTLPAEFHGPTGWFEAGLRRGDLVLLFDGVDEVGSPHRRRELVQWIEEQIAAWSKNVFVVTSRPYGYRENPLDSATVLQVRPFTEAQVQQFVHQWYLAVEERAAGKITDVVTSRAEEGSAAFLAELPSVPGLLDLAANPLLLTMATNVHYYRGALPATRTELYSEICEVLLGLRDAAKGIATVPLTTAQKQSMLRKLAIEMMIKRTRTLAEDLVVDMLESQLPRYGVDLNSADLLAYFQDGTGLFLELEPGSWAFAHLTFQEYLAAGYLLETRRVPPWQNWWSECIAFWAAQIDPSDEVEASLSELDEEGSATTLANIAVCVDSARELRVTARQMFERILEDHLSRLSPVAFNIIYARKRRSMARISPDTYCRVSLLSEGEYEFFVHDRAGKGENRRILTLDQSRPSPRIEYPISGVRAIDAFDFIQWVNTKSEANYRIRLPTEREVSLLPRSVVDDGTVWATRGAAGVVTDGNASRLAIDEEAFRIVPGIIDMYSEPFSFGEPPSVLRPEVVLAMMREDLRILHNACTSRYGPDADSDLLEAVAAAIPLGIVESVQNAVIHTVLPEDAAALFEIPKGVGASRAAVDVSWRFLCGALRDGDTIGALAVDPDRCIRWFEANQPGIYSMYTSTSADVRLVAHILEISGHLLPATADRNGSRGATERSLLRGLLYCLFSIAPWLVACEDSGVRIADLTRSVAEFRASTLTAGNGILAWAVDTAWTLTHLSLRIQGLENAWERVVLIEDAS